MLINDLAHRYQAYESVDKSTFQRSARILQSIWRTEQGYEIKIGKFPFRGLGKSMATGETDGFVKVIYDAKYGEMLGCHIIGAEATNLITEAVIARKLETTHQEVLNTIHPHPTLSEAIMEATADALGEAIHI